MRRLIVGLVGALLGLGLGAGLAFTTRGGLEPTALVVFVALLGMLVSGLLGRPPHRHESAFESFWRGLVGLVVGAGLGGAALHFVGARPLPFAVPPLPADVHLLEHPAIVGFAAGAVLGLLIGMREEAPPATPSTKPAA